VPSQPSHGPGRGAEPWLAMWLLGITGSQRLGIESSLQTERTEDQPPVEVGERAEAAVELLAQSSLMGHERALVDVAEFGSEGVVCEPSRSHRCEQLNLPR
jgi:hypothetical protein